MTRRLTNVEQFVELEFAREAVRKTLPIPHPVTAYPSAKIFP
jgi:hypothetical protein